MVQSCAHLDPAPAHLQLKVTLLDIRPAIWRRLLVPAKLKLPQLHTALQRAFGWTDSHLHAFQSRDASYEAFHPDDWAGDFSGPGQRYDEKKFRVGDLLRAKGDQLTDVSVVRVRPELGQRLIGATKLTTIHSARVLWSFACVLLPA